MLNTWGIAAINHNTFNTHSIVEDISQLPAHAELSASYRPEYKIHYFYFPKEHRDQVLTLARIYQLSLNTLGYMNFIPYFPAIAGTLRIAGGIVLLGTTLIKGGESKNKMIAFAGNFYDEALQTALGQVVRGIFEIYRPHGHNVNFYLDAIGTIWNLAHVGAYCVDYYTGSNRIAFGKSKPVKEQLVEGPDHHPIFRLA